MKNFQNLQLILCTRQGLRLCMLVICGEMLTGPYTSTIQSRAMKNSQTLQLILSSRQGLRLCMLARKMKEWKNHSIEQLEIGKFLFFD